MPLVPLVKDKVFSTIEANTPYVRPVTAALMASLVALYPKVIREAIFHYTCHGNSIVFVVADGQGELAGLSTHWLAPFMPPVVWDRRVS